MEYEACVLGPLFFSPENKNTDKEVVSPQSQEIFRPSISMSTSFFVMLDKLA